MDVRLVSGGCPWDREQDHKSIRFHAVEEVYELIDVIEAEDDHEMLEECGDLLLQWSSTANLRRNGRRLILRRRPGRSPTSSFAATRMFSEIDADNVDAVWAQWEKIKRGKTGHETQTLSVLLGIPRHLPSLQLTEKLVKKARKNKLADKPLAKPSKQRYTKVTLARELLYR